MPVVSSIIPLRGIQPAARWGRGQQDVWVSLRIDMFGTRLLFIFLQTLSLKGKGQTNWAQSKTLGFSIVPAQTFGLQTTGLRLITSKCQLSVDSWKPLYFFFFFLLEEEQTYIVETMEEPFDKNAASVIKVFSSFIPRLEIIWLDLQFHDDSV